MTQPRPSVTPCAVCGDCDWFAVPPHRRTSEWDFDSDPPAGVCTFRTRTVEANDLACFDFQPLDANP
jgi:hypothetical protein